MALLKSTDRMCVAGLPGTGKTTFLKYWVAKAEPRVYIIDPLNQYSEFGEIGDVSAGKHRHVSLSGNRRLEFEAICHRFHSISNYVLVVEEAEQFMPQGRDLGLYTNGLIQMGRIPDRRTKSNFQCILLLSLLIFPILGLLAYAVSRAFSMNSLGFNQLLFICLVAGLFTTLLAILVTYYSAHLFVKIGVDPDNVTIPLITSVMDVLGTASLILVTMAIVSA